MKTSSVVFVILTAILSPIICEGQQWLSRIPKKNAEELTFYDFKTAFEAHYKEHPVDVRREPINVNFSFNAQEATTKAAIEDYKQFKRWEWFTEPRVYPSGRWDNPKVIAEFQRVKAVDSALLTKVGGFVITLQPKWSILGPSDAIGGTNLGRVNAIAIDPTNAKTLYAGAPGGGVWKSIDYGANWTTSTDSLPTLSIGDIAIDPANPKNVYVATGDAFGYGNPFWGGTYTVGVWKSADAGATWAATGLSFVVGQNRTIRRLAIDPTNSKILMAATSAGLFRTADAGATWTNIWADSTYDVEFNPANGNTVYATTNQVKKSADAGVTWSTLSASCAGQRYNIEVAKSNPNVLYTLCTNSTVQKSTNAGSTWTTTTAPGVTLYGYYDNVLAVSPVDANIAIVAGFDIKKTTNGGTTWASVPTAGHVDNHCIRFATGSSTTIYGGNDGGLFRTTNGGTTWSSLNKGLAITQFYRVGLSTLTPTLLVAGAQDNGNMKFGGGAWSNVTGADGMGGYIDFSNDNNVYMTIQYGTLYRSTNGGASWTGISTPAAGAWVTPHCQSKTVASTIFAGTDKVYKSTNQGTTWTAISAALPGTGLLTILKTHKNANYLLAGSGHKLYRTTNAGGTWTDITGTLPVASNYLTDAVMNDNDPNMIWATFSGYNAGQKVYKTTNGGTTWTNISGTLPNIPANCVQYENKAGNPIYVGTDAGVYYVKDGLADFVPYKFGLPNVIVDSLEIQYGAKKIVAGTYGRGTWQVALKP